MDPDIQDAQEIQVDIPVESPDNHEEQATDSYDELAKTEVAEPIKRGRGRPKGSRNRVKVPPPPPSESEEEEETLHPVGKAHAKPPPPASRGRSPQRENPKTHALNVEFDEGYILRGSAPGGAGPPPWNDKPVRVKRKPAAVSLMEIIAQAANQQSERERGRRRTFYENYLPL